MFKRNTYNLLLAFSFLILLCGVVSCSSNKKKDVRFEEILQQPQMQLSSQDTTEVRKQVTDFLEKVKAGNTDEAVKMLYRLSPKGVIEKLPAAQMAEQKKALGAFKVYGYRIDFMKFYKETDCQVKYFMILQDPEQCKQNNVKPAEIGCLIRPVRHEGKWFICLANTSTESKNSEIE